MAQTTAELIARTIGRQSGGGSVGGFNLPSNPTTFMPQTNVAGPSFQGMPTVQPPVQPTAPAPAPTAATAPAPQPSQPAVPQPPPQSAPAPQPSSRGGIDPVLTRLLQERAQGVGVGPSFAETIEGRFLPEVALLEEQSGRGFEQGLEGLVSRGILQSGESQQFGEDVIRGLERDRSALFGQLASEFNRERQANINQALNQLNVLEGNKLNARTAIRVASIGAAAQRQAASLAAGATRDAAAISAKARLDEAGLNARVALQRLDADMASIGIDFQLLQTDPGYRDATLTTIRALDEQRTLLENALMEQELLDRATGGVPE